MKKRTRIIYEALLPAALILIFLLREPILGLKKFFPECDFYILTGYLCPGCGNTRCVTHLLNGDIVSAIRCNITIPFLFILLILLYAENTAALAGREIRLLSRKLWVWLAVIALFTLYFIVRNFIPEIAPI